MTHLRPKRPMTCEEVFGAPEPGNGELNLAALQKGLGLERPLEEKAFLEILRRGKEVLSQESNILKISSEEVVVIGPVRGSYYDMINMMACFTGTKVESDDGYTPTAEEPFTPACQEPITIKDNQVFLFIGDLIDGGHHSSQVLLLLLAIKSMHPDKLYITRGRRESKTDWDEKGHSILLSTELRRKYHFCDHEKLYTECLQVFKTFPIAGVVNANFWCASGGIGPGMQHLNSINRTEDIMKSSHLCDIVWSDPMDDEDEDLQATALFLHNFEKGLAFNYSFNAVMHFLQDNKLKAIIRGVSFTDNRETALQVTRQTHNTTGRPWHFQYSCYDPGYRLFRKSPLNNFPVVMSLFSSPWFLDENENKGAAMLIKDDLVEVKQFTAARRPYALPRMEDGLEWSVPMVAMQATQVVEV